MDVFVFFYLNEKDVSQFWSKFYGASLDKNLYIHKILQCIYNINTAEKCQKKCMENLKCIAFSMKSDECCLIEDYNWSYHMSEQAKGIQTVEYSKIFLI